MDRTEILIRNGFVEINDHFQAPAGTATVEALGTIVSNMAYYGFAPSTEVLNKLSQKSDAELKIVWGELKNAFLSDSGENRAMEEFVVYKNFPQEVLDKTDAEYWVAQIFMYLGAPSDFFTEEVKTREPLDERLELKVLHLAGGNALSEIAAQLKVANTGWTPLQLSAAVELLDEMLDREGLDIDAFGFKHNAISVAFHAFERGLGVRCTAATDVMRLGAALSGFDANLRFRVRFRKFKRKERKALLAMLENCTGDLKEDFATRPEPWKKFLYGLHPGDYGFAKVSKAFDALCKGEIETYSKTVEPMIAAGEIAVLDIVKTRPGDFMRRLHHLYSVFGSGAFEAFKDVLPQLTSGQLLKIGGYLATINNRKSLLFPPRGSWERVQRVENTKIYIREEHLRFVQHAIQDELRSRLGQMYPEGFNIDPRVASVKLQSNDQMLAEYGRGTVLDLPENVNFIRTSSYWEHKTGNSSWFDNGWNFFDENWESKGACCWDRVGFGEKAAVFSGDPVNSQEVKGRGCQLVDIYIDQLLKEGVRYALWSVLSFSHIEFDKPKDVFATLQWGKDAQKGGLIEPSRAQMAFRITGKGLTRYVAYVDLHERKLVYMDANLPSFVESAGRNGKLLSEMMPGYIEHLDSLPGVADLFSNGRPGEIPVLFDDAEAPVKGAAYVFKKLNPDSELQELDVPSMLVGTGSVDVREKARREALTKLGGHRLLSERMPKDQLQEVIDSDAPFEIGEPPRPGT